MNTYLGGLTGTDGYCPIILPSSLGISKWIMEIFKIFVCTFSASKQEIQSQQHFVIILRKMFITTLHYKCHQEQQISEYMKKQEQSDCNNLIKSTIEV